MANGTILGIPIFLASAALLGYGFVQPALRLYNNTSVDKLRDQEQAAIALGAAIASGTASMLLTKVRL